MCITEMCLCGIKPNGALLFLIILLLSSWLQQCTVMGQFKKYKMQSKELTSSPIMEMSVRSVFLCLTLCESTPSCVNINYYESQESCQLLGIPLPSDVYVSCLYCQSKVLDVSNKV